MHAHLFPARARHAALSLLALAVAAACTGGGRAPATRTPGAERRPSLPPIPLAEGPLRIRVQYPGANQLVEARDSNFIHGSIGNGRATLTINGAPVQVHPNGAFIAFLPVPPAERPVYELVATLGEQTVRDSLRIRVAAPRARLDSARFLDSASVSPRAAGTMLRADEPVRVSARALPAASVWVRWDTAAGAPPVRQALVRTGESWATEVPAAALARGAVLVAARGADTARIPLARVEIVDPVAPRLVILGGDGALVSNDTDRTIPGRAYPAGGYSWAFLPGTVLQMTGRQGAFTRVRLDATLEAWVDTDAVALLPAGSALPRRTVGAMTLTPSREWVDVQIPTGDRPPYLVKESGNTIELVLYGTRLGPSLVRWLENDSLVRYMTWEQETSDRARLTMHLSERPFGYLALFDRGMFTLRVRRPPEIERRRPLRGLTIAVDAGHPPAGATGPTGLYEGDAVLPVADRVGRLLEQRGATVVRIRTTSEPYGLAQRSIDARRANAHALVSVHLNALPDGVNPFVANGSSVLYYHPQAEPMARAIERELVRQYGLRDLGVHYQNISIGRTTWMPSVITEGLFVMMPEQEAAMRSEEGREQYARAIVDGLEDYFRWMAGR